ncbi:MAG: hypothetical protein MI723_19240, partial [Caulobacterales bacterium]|nr:hypothetical protein [Caulobacterales bacterium]
GAAPADVPGPISCPVNAARIEEQREFEIYRLAARKSVVMTALGGSCDRAGAGQLGDQHRASRAADDRRCAWLAAGGRARALEGTRFMERGDRINGLLALSSALGVYDTAQRSCSGLAYKRVARTRGQLAGLISAARGHSPKVSEEAGKVRLALLEERGGGFAVLFGAQEPADHGSFLCDAGGGDATLTPASQSLRFADDVR